MLIMELYLIIVLFISAAQTENLCNKIPRAPSPGCCPDAYLHLCCRGIPPCNASKVVVPPTPAPGNSSGSKWVTFRGHNVSRYPCSPPWSTPACGRGFYILNGSVEACPTGFYCPELSTCIVPCLSGAYCKQYEYSFGYSPAMERAAKPFCKRMGICCVSWQNEFATPTEVTLRNGSMVFKCPGMFHPKACPKGNYCPDPTKKVICKSGHYCPVGSVEPIKCPLMSKCYKGESAPHDNAAGPLLALLLVLLIVAAYQFYFHFSDIKIYCISCFQRERNQPITRFYVNDCEPYSVIMDAQTETEIQPRDFPINISIRNLSLTLKSRDKKKVLSGVTGAVLSGEVTAVMGPSGAGKTTFLNTLSGKAYYGKISGEIKVNGEVVDSLSKYRKVTGFVPQEDIMHRKLTVEEVLMFQGRLRLPGSTPAEKIKERVVEIMTLLEIAHVAKVQIGDEDDRGISGGQRKRVNIGMELIADPTLLFLDEPTSGLDSTSSLSVLRALRAVAEKGRLTVVCVIHQPRYEIFAMFHKVLFLGPGGRTVYQGSVKGARKYFDALGCPCPANINPADHYMDVISGSASNICSQIHPDMLFHEWNDRVRRENGKLNGNGGCDNAEVNPNVFRDRPMPSIFLQFLVFLQREGTLQFRHIRSLMFDMFLVLLAGGVLGALYAEVTLEKVITMNTMSAFAIGLTAILASLRCFGNHRTTYWRESAAGVNKFSYFLAVNVCQLPIILIAPLIYLSLQYTFSWPQALFKYHYVAVFMAQFATAGIGYTISCIFNPRNSQMAAVVIVLISTLLSGTIPTLCQLDEINMIGPIAYSLSFSRWFAEALFEKEVERLPPIRQKEIDFFAFQNNYDLESYGQCIAVLFAYGIFFRFLSFLCLIFTNRGKQK